MSFASLSCRNKINPPYQSAISAFLQLGCEVMLFLLLFPNSHAFGMSGKISTFVFPFGHKRGLIIPIPTEKLVIRLRGTVKFVGIFIGQRNNNSSQKTCK